MSFSLLAAESAGLTWAAWGCIIAGGLAALAALVAWIVKMILSIKYYRFNHCKIKRDLTAQEVATLLLQGLKLDDVKIEKRSFFTEYIYGNGYSAYSNTIKLRRNLWNKKTITAVGVATQKVAIAEMQNKGDKQTVSRNKLQPLVLFAPFLFVPFVILGVVVDVLLKSNQWIGTLIGIIIGLIFFIISFIVLLLSMKVEKAANKRACELLQTTNMLDDEELLKIKSYYKTYELSLVVDFIMTCVYIVQFIFKLIFNILNKASKIKK